MKKLLLLAGLMIALMSYSCKSAPKEGIELVTPQEMQELAQMEDVQLVDVRTPGEYEEAYIDGFQNIDYLSDTFSADIEKLDKSKPVIVYCKSGRRSANCAEELKEKGFVKVYDLDGGIEKWKYEGFDIKTLP
jgi:rhodanese-related sulfurtransferase